MANDFYTFGRFRVDRANRMLFDRDTRVALGPKVFDTLLILVESAGQLVTKERLLTEVWPDTLVEEGSLSRNIYLLRKVLEAGGIECIETVPKLGYRFIAPVVAVPVAASEAVQETAVDRAEPPERPQLTARALRFWPAWLAVASLVLMGTARLYFPPSPTTPVDSLAILPFAARGAGADLEYLGDGLTEDLINSLSHLPGLRVVSRQSVFAFKGKGYDASAVARQLGVRAILTGEILRQASSTWVRVELIDTADNRHLWGDRFQLSQSGLLAAKDEISQGVSRALRLSISESEQRREAKRSTKVPEAYNLYLQGRFHLNKYTEQGLRKAIERFGGAVALDPHYAHAYAGTAEAYHWLANMYVPARVGMPEARRASVRALELNEEVAEAHTSLALVLSQYEWDWDRAGIEYRRAVELNPGFAPGRHWYGRYLAFRGRYSESAGELQRARELDPISPLITVDAGWPLFFQRDYDGAIKQFRKALELDDRFMVAHWVLGWAYESKGQLPEAIRQYQRAAQIEDGPVILGFLAHAYASAGRRNEAEALLERLTRESSATAGSSIAAVNEALGRRSEAVKWLETAFEQRDEWMIWMHWDPRFDQLRRDPRVIRMIDQIGLQQAAP